MIPTYKTLFLAFVTALFAVGCGDKSIDSPGANSPATTREAGSSLDALKKAAEGGDAKAQFDFGMRFVWGNGVEANPKTALEWMLKGAEGGNAAAMWYAGSAYEEGFGVTKDLDKSKMWIKKAAEAGNVDAQYSYARTFGQTSRATWILGSKEDKPEFARQYTEWLDKASKQGHKTAQYELGMTYLLGANEFSWDANSKKIIESDTDKALPLLKTSADSGYWQAQWAVAVLYQSGFGKIKGNKDESDKYWKLFAEQTDPDVQNRIGVLYGEDQKKYYTDGKNKYQGKALDFVETNKVAFEWYRKSAEQNNKYAQYNLGRMYGYGLGVFKDEKKAFEYYEKSAKQGHFTSMSEVAFAYLDGTGVVKDYTEAYNWLVKAAEGEDENRARNALGVLYEFGWGVDKDIVLAYAWYNIAASADFGKAKENLVRVEKVIKREDLREAQTLSREWKPGKLMARADVPQNVTSATGSTSSATASNSKTMKLSSVGTGFYISPNGNVLTNNHVVDGCGEIRIPLESSKGKLVVADQSNDLALVKLEVSGKPSLQFPSADELKQGEEVFAFGFPLDGYLPGSGNITTGIISALAGPSNNSSLIQTTAPVQPGNSGGPLMNKKGNVVGVVVGKANAIKIAKVTGDIPQNINFAISARTVKSFLDGNNIEYRKKGDTFTFDKDSVAIAEEARKASLKIECWR
jgi:TPR repeat protein